MEHLALYSRNCKVCKSLDPEESKLFPKCHFSAGNKQCPAAEIQFAVVGEARRLASQVRKARVANDLKREIEILNLVEKRSTAFQQKFKDWLDR